MNPSVTPPSNAPLYWYATLPNAWPVPPQYRDFPSAPVWIPASAAPFVPLATGAVPQPTAAGSSAADSQTAEPPRSPAELELQALNEFLQRAAATSIQQLFQYLEQNAPQFTQLSALLPVVSQAIEAFRTQDHAQAFTLAFQASRAITLLRTQTPDLPPLAA